MGIRFWAFGQEFALKLRRNRQFLSPAFQVRAEDARLGEALRLQQPHCFYYGHSEHHPNSTVAVSLCDGIVSLACSRVLLWAELCIDLDL